MLTDLIVILQLRLLNLILICSLYYNTIEGGDFSKFCLEHCSCRVLCDLYLCALTLSQS